MRFGISTHLYHDTRLTREHLLEPAGAGFREIEVFAATGHFDYRDDAAVTGLAGWLHEAGLSLHSVHAPIVEHLRDGRWGPPLSIAAASEEVRAHAVAETLAAVRVARTVPFRNLVVHLGIPDSLQPPAGSNTAAAAARSVEDIVAAAGPLGVQVALEVVPNALSTAEAIVRLLEDDLDLPPRSAGICLDLGHAFLMGDLLDAIDVVSGELVTTHVHDNRGRTDDHLVPFDGSIDWPAALMSLRKVGYDGPFVFELAGGGASRDVLARTGDVRKRFEAILAQ